MRVDHSVGRTGLAADAPTVSPLVIGAHAMGGDAATTVTLVEPAVATVLAVVILDEQLGIVGWSGMTLLGVALLILVAPQRR